MSTPGTLSAGLAHLPAWWQETNEPTAFDNLLTGMVRACGWRSAGFIWPAETIPAIMKVAPAGAGSDAIVPPEVFEVARAIRAGDRTVTVQSPNSSGRVYAGVHPPGRQLGLVWAERHPGQTWSEEERAYLALVGRTIERSPAVALAVGPMLDPERIAQRLADASIIAGRMAHDFDNILTGIMGFADLTVPLLPPGSQQASFVAEIAKVGQRGIVFTQQLHQLNRGGQIRPNPGSVVATLGREETRLRAVMHPAVRIEKDLPAGLPAVAVEAGPLQTALGHVFENAIEACPQGGLVRVSARVVDLTDADTGIFLGKATAGPHVLVTITDSGTGIKPEVRRRLFVEPFYTTKVRHRGLGLATAFRIITAHRGGLQLDSVPPPGTGTQVRVVLPLALSRQTSPCTNTPPPAQSGINPDLVRTPNPTATSVRG